MRHSKLLTFPRVSAAFNNFSNPNPSACASTCRLHPGYSAPVAIGSDRIGSARIGSRLSHKIITNSFSPLIDRISNRHLNYSQVWTIVLLALAAWRRWWLTWLNRQSEPTAREARGFRYGSIQYISRDCRSLKSSRGPDSASWKNKKCSVYWMLRDGSEMLLDRFGSTFIGCTR